MKKQYNSKLLLSKEDFITTKDREYIWFLPGLIIFIIIFAALSPLLKGLSFIPIFIVLLLGFIAITFLYNLKNKEIAKLTDAEFKEKELIKFNLTLNEDNITVYKNGEEATIKYSSIFKIEEYETFYLINTNNSGFKYLPVCKETAEFKDGSDLFKFIFSKTKIKKKKVKKIHLRKQKAFVSVIALGILTFAILLPIIYILTNAALKFGPGRLL